MFSIQLGAKHFSFCLADNKTHAKFIIYETTKENVNVKFNKRFSCYKNVT